MNYCEFRNLYLNLIFQYKQQCHFQVKLCELYDEFEESSFDDEDFLDFRDKCSDLLKDIVYIVGKKIIDSMYKR